MGKSGAEVPARYLRGASEVIFVTVGNPIQGFRRLLDAVDDLAGDGVFGDQSVFVQTGHNPGFEPRYCEAKPFVSMEEFEGRMRDAALIICQGGSTVLAAVRLGKVPVVMPRMKKYHEHVNDHQVQFVRALAVEKWLIPAYEPENLPGAIAEGLTAGRVPMAVPPSQMCELVARAIQELRHGNPRHQRLLL